MVAGKRYVLVFQSRRHGQQRGSIVAVPLSDLAWATWPAFVAFNAAAIGIAHDNGVQD
jgi:hypothetical protein